MTRDLDAKADDETLSVAHRRSEFAVIDPLYDARCVVPIPDCVPGAPWVYGDAELETWRLHVMRARSKAVCLNAGYPGAYHEPSSVATFRLASVPCDATLTDMRLTAVGDVVVTWDGVEVYRAPNRSDVHVVRFGARPRTVLCDLRIKLVCADGEPPGIRVEDGPFSTARDTWRYSADGKEWGPVTAFPPTADHVPPHRAEQPTLEIEPVATTSDGLIDFGLTLLGRPSFRCEGQPALVVGESVEEANDQRPEVHEQCLDIQRQADGRWASQHPLAFRYLRISGGAPRDVRADIALSPARYRGAFACSDKRLTRIWMQCATTLRMCMNDLAVDGLKRDRLPWIGDQAVNLMVNAYTFANDDLYRRTFTALGRAGIEVKDINGIVDYSLWWVINQDVFQRYFDDPDYLRREWPRVKALLEHLEGRCGEDGLLVPRPKAWLFIDWGVEKNGDLTNVPLQMLWFWALESGAALAERVGDSDTARAWRDRALALAQRLHHCAWDADARGWRMFVETPGHLSRHANLLAVNSGLATCAQYAGIRAHLLGAALPPVITPFMTSLELMALARVGAVESLFGRIEMYWGAMLDRGATTFWEAYDPIGTESDYAMYGRPYANSLCHAWGSGPAALLPGEVLGIRPLADGWKRFSVDPRIGPLDWVAATVPTPCGDIEAVVEDGHLSLGVPNGATAVWRERELVGPVTIAGKL